MTALLLDPARSIIAKCGGTGEVARVTGRHRTNVYRWQRAVDDGGTGGMIPAREFKKLLIYARKMGINLKPEEAFRESRAA